MRAPMTPKATPQTATRVTSSHSPPSAVQRLPVSQMRGQDRDEQRQPVEVERQRAEVEGAAGRAGDGAEHGADTATTARTGTGERVRTWLG